eukprot:PhM_4_TR18893/c0_g1_i1/m.20351
MSSLDGGVPTENTIDEPVLTTVLRDAKSISRKILAVAVPFDIPGFNKETVNYLVDWDLWGPLVLCLTLAMVLGSHASESQHGIVFCGVFFLVWLGGGVVTINAKVLGCKLSFFQIICVLGYCLAPLCLSSMIISFVSSMWAVKVPIAAIAWFWSSVASHKFFSASVNDDKRMLVVYPIILFYFFFCWMQVVGI